MQYFSKVISVNRSIFPALFMFFIFCNRLAEEERGACFALVAFLMSCVSWCSVSTPHPAVGWSALCDSGISWTYSLFEHGKVDVRKPLEHPTWI